MHTQVAAAQTALSEKLIEKIQAVLLEQSGWMSFEQYMQMVLYTPGLGYYSGTLEKFGEAGDFITAPEMGDLFGRCIAGQAQQVLAELGSGNLLEFGAGSGVLAASILNELAEHQALPDTYFILELSAELRQRQKQTLERLAAGYVGRVKWLDTLPDNFRGMVIANEVLDAMPVKIFEQDMQGHISEMGVSLNEQAVDSVFAWQPGIASVALQEAVKSLNLVLDTPVYRSEINFQARAWIHSLAEMLEQGVILLVDYGFSEGEYYHPDRNQGTLMCHYQHRAHEDPFFLPGLQDITAHVDFSAVAGAAHAAGLELEGYATQGGFLLSAGLLGQIELDASVQQQLQLAQQVKKLTMPHEMGELFKVLALSRDFDSELSGFAGQNYAYKL